MGQFFMEKSLFARRFLHRMSQLAIVLQLYIGMATSNKGG